MLMMICFLQPDGANKIKRLMKNVKLRSIEIINIGLQIFFGHLYRGRGIDLIVKLAEHQSSFRFHIVGGM